MRYRAGPRLQHRRALLQLSARQLRRAVRRGRSERPRPAEDDERSACTAGCSASPGASDRCSASWTTSSATPNVVWICRRIDIARHWKQVHPFNADTAFVWELNTTMLTLERAQCCDAGREDSRRAARQAPMNIHPGWPRSRLAEAAPSFTSTAALKLALVARRCAKPGLKSQLALVRSPTPNWPARRWSARTLTAASSDERAGPARAWPTARPKSSTSMQQPEHRLQHEASAGPFMLAVRGPRGHGPDTRHEIIATFERRGWPASRDFEFAEALRNIHRVAEIRLERQASAKTPALEGNQRVGLGRSTRGCTQRPRLQAEAGPADGDLPQPTRTSAAARQLVSQWMRAECRFRRGRASTRWATWSGVYLGALTLTARRLAHRQPLRHRAQRRQVRRPPGYPGADAGRGARRCKAAPAGACRSAWRWWVLRKKKVSATRPPSWAAARWHGPLRSGVARRSSDVDGITHARARCAQAGLRGDAGSHNRAEKRDPAKLPRFRRSAHRTGPGALNELDLPLGIVTSINGSLRFLGEVHRRGQPCRHHADGPPPRRRLRRGRAGALRRAARGARDAGDVVGDRWACCRCPSGSHQRGCPAAASFSLDLRATTNDEARDALGGRREGRTSQAHLRTHAACRLHAGS